MMRTKKQWSILSALVLVLSMVLVPGLIQADSPAPAAIRLVSASFTPAMGQAPSIPPGLTISGYAPGQRGYYIVQFTGPVQQSWKDQAAAQGADLLGYLPDFAFKVRMNPAQAARVEALESVAWVGLYQPAFKLSPNLALGGTNLYRVRIERGADTGQATAAIARSGAQILSRQGDLLQVAADAAQVEAIAQVLDVAWVENLVLKEKHNEYGAGVILGANTANSNGYNGSTQIAAVADTGLGGGTASTAHPDIPASRVVSINNWPGQTNICFQSIVDDGAQDVDSGHGTHTSASVLGDGGSSGEGKGVAPAAGLVFQATENYAYISNYCQIVGGWPAQGYFLTGLPDDLHALFQQAYNAGARIHSNSWGAALAGDYTLDSANTDDFIWDNPDMTITFSAGNEGFDNNADGIVDSDSTGSPATAKNVLTVGASENDRQGNYQCDPSLTYTSHDAYQTSQTCAGMGGNQVNFLGTWGQRYGFPTNPLKDDVTAGNAQQMASWSSRGPTDDGRIKPDVVAPGTWILSGYSGLYQEGYGDPVNPQNGVYQWDGWGMPRNAAYKYMGGTSMANPIAAGAATVVRDYYQKAHSHAASAALVKATLINSAVDLLDENNDGANDNDYPIPNVHEGWGRVNVANATDNSHQFVEAAAGLGTGGSASYPFTVSSGTPFKVSLVWSDYASTEAAAQNLVNDLDLIVTAPGGQQYRGNVFSGGWSQTGGSADRVNNVENVYVQSPAAGTWTVQVSGYNVPNGPQPYALVVDGNFGPTDSPPSVTVDNPAEGSTVSGAITVVALASDDNGVTQVAFFVDGASIGIDTNGDDGWAMPWNSATVADGSHVVSATATDTIGQTGSDSNNITVDNVNDPPVASFTYNCTGLACNFDASGSGDPDGTIAAYDWDFGDGNTGTGMTPGHSYAAAGTYTVELTVTDNGGATGTDSQGVTVSAPLPGIHIGDLDGSTSPASKGRWNARVTVRVHSTDESPVAGATVSGIWGASASGTGSCVTTHTGECFVDKSNIKGTSVTFTVSGVSHASLAYNPGANHDPDGDSDGTTIAVATGGNQTPAAAFAPSCTLLNCSFNATGSSDPDGSIASYNWDFGDASYGSGVTASHTYAAAGTYTVVLVIRDNNGAIDIATQAVTVSATAAYMHVGDLDGTTSAAKGGRWNATITITVHSTSHNPLAGATVSGSWSAGASGSGSCTTGASGQCAITNSNISKTSNSATFTVDTVTHTSYVYDQGSNHDVDGGSNGTAITVAKP